MLLASPGSFSIGPAVLKRAQRAAHLLRGHSRTGGRKNATHIVKDDQVQFSIDYHVAIREFDTRGIEILHVSCDG